MFLVPSDFGELVRLSRMLAPRSLHIAPLFDGLTRSSGRRSSVRAKCAKNFLGPRGHKRDLVCCVTKMNDTVARANGYVSQKEPDKPCICAAHMVPSGAAEQKLDLESLKRSGRRDFNVDAAENTIPLRYQKSS